MEDLKILHTLLGNSNFHHKDPIFSDQAKKVGSATSPKKNRQAKSSKDASSESDERSQSSATGTNSIARLPKLVPRSSNDSVSTATSNCFSSQNDNDSFHSDVRSRSTAISTNSTAGLPKLIPPTRNDSISTSSSNSSPLEKDNDSFCSNGQNNDSHNIDHKIPGYISFDINEDDEPITTPAVPMNEDSTSELFHQDVQPISDSTTIDEISPIGGDMSYQKQEGSIHISRCNPNGINNSNLKSQLQQSMDLDIDIQCYPEVNANFLNTKLRRLFYEKSKSMDPHSTCTWCTSEVIIDSDYKPGGTGIVSRGSSARRIKSSGFDKLGRWSWQLLSGKNNKEVLIVSVYQCCQTHDNPNAKSTAYLQQKILLSEQNRSNLDPRTNFRKDLIEFIQKFRDNNSTIIPIIVGDWNKEFTDDSTADVLCSEFGLVNIFDILHPEHPTFKTYKRGSKTIDYAIAPPDIAERVTNFVYEPFLYRFKGDHRAFYFNISEQILFGNVKPSSSDHLGRGFSSKDVKSTKIYLEKIHEVLNNNNIFLRIERLLRSHSPDHEEAEKINRTITEACKAGESICCRHKKSYLSIKLHKTKRELTIWCILQSWKRRKITLSPIINRVIARMA